MAITSIVSSRPWWVIMLIGLAVGFLILPKVL